MAASSVGLSQWMEALSAGQSAVLVAVGAGMLGLVVAFCMSGRGSTHKRREEEAKDKEAEEVSSSTENEKKTEPQKKQWKVKNTGKPRKTTLPSHPLLAADFKGHTGAVLSMDFDSTGRYLVSCSEGGVFLCKTCILYFYHSRSDDPTVVHEDAGGEGT